MQNAECRKMKKKNRAPKLSIWRTPRNVFEVMLERWRRGENVSWGDLFASWVKLPAAPRSRETVRRVIRKVEWIR
jgi:hypothetical protein